MLLRSNQTALYGLTRVWALHPIHSQGHSLKSSFIKLGILNVTLILSEKHYSRRFNLCSDTWGSQIGVSNTSKYQAIYGSQTKGQDKLRKKSCVL